MTSAARKKASTPRGPVAMAEASVSALHSAREVSVKLTGARTTKATLAVAGDYRPRVNDVVLVASSAEGKAYVVGVLTALRQVSPSVTTSDGMMVSVTGERGADVLEVRDREGKLLFEHRAAERKSVIHAPQGDIELRADDGNIDLTASQKVRVRAAQGVEITSDRAVSMGVTPSEQLGSPGSPGSSVKLDARGASLSTPFVRASAQRAEVSVDDGRLTAKRWSTAIERVHQVVGVLESRATRIIEHAKNVYREVEDLSQVRAGRMRLVADTTFHLLGKRALFKAREEVSIQGERIYLA